MLEQCSGLVLLAVFADGAVAGILLMGWSIVLCQIWERGRRASKRQDAQPERLVEIDEEGMLCPCCWERRHPGQVWRLSVGARCRKHRLNAVGRIPGRCAFALTDEHSVQKGGR